MHAALHRFPIHHHDRNYFEHISNICKIFGAFRHVAWRLPEVHLTLSARFECWSVVQLELQDCNRIPAFRWAAEETTLQSYERLIWPIPKKVDSARKYCHSKANARRYWGTASRRCWIAPHKHAHTEQPRGVGRCHEATEGSLVHPRSMQVIPLLPSSV